MIFPLYEEDVGVCVRKIKETGIRWAKMIVKIHEKGYIPDL